MFKTLSFYVSFQHLHNQTIPPLELGYDPIGLGLVRQNSKRQDLPTDREHSIEILFRDLWNLDEIPNTNALKKIFEKYENIKKENVEEDKSSYFHERMMDWVYQKLVLIQILVAEKIKLPKDSGPDEDSMDENEKVLSQKQDTRIFGKRTTVDLYKKSNEVVGHEQIATVIQALLNMPGSPSLLLTPMWSEQSYQYQASPHPQRPFDFQINISLESFVKTVVSHLLMHVFDMHRNNFIVFNPDHTEEGHLISFDHKRIGGGTRLHKEEDTYFVPFRSVLLQCKEMGQIIPDTLRGDVITAFEAINYFFNTQASETPFFNRLKTQIQATIQRLDPLLRSSARLKSEDLFIAVHPRLEKYVQVLKEALGASVANKEEFSIFSLMNMPLHQALTFVMATGVNKEKLADALLQLFFEEGTERAEQPDDAKTQAKAFILKKLNEVAPSFGLKPDWRWSPNQFIQTVSEFGMEYRSQMGNWKTAVLEIVEALNVKGIDPYHFTAGMKSTVSPSPVDKIPSREDSDHLFSAEESLPSSRASSPGVTYDETSDGEDSEEEDWSEGNEDYLSSSEEEDDIVFQ